MPGVNSNSLSHSGLSLHDDDPVADPIVDPIIHPHLYSGAGVPKAVEIC